MKNKKKSTVLDALKLFLVWSGMLLFLTLAVFLVQQNALFFQASLIPTIQAPAYDGLTMPVQKAPDYVALTSAERSLSFNELPASKIINIPVYDPVKLKTPTDSLKWGNAADNVIRNMKITYSVPYMGNYKLDNVEYGGGHLAVDIKIPTGTPVYAIGNGIVVKKQEQSSGFGNHIVIEHKNFPSFDNPSVKTTYYSSYNHLSKIVVSEGSVVKKGQLIAYSGNSGLSTTPHLHFQIDKDSAPWHPFWHFTTKEASDAGYNFTQAINAGFNKDKAIANTINPLMYVQKYQNSTTVSTTTTNTSTTTTTPVTTTTSSNTNTTNNNTNTTTTTSPTNTTDNTTTETQTENSNDTTTVQEVVIPDSPTTTIDNSTDEYVTFEIEGDDTFTPGTEKMIAIIAKDRSGNTVTNYVPPTAVRIETIQGVAQFNPSRLTSSNFVDGVAKIIMTTSSENSVQFMVKSDTVMVESQIMNTGIFVDISKTHPNFEAISFLKDEGVIQGYPDGSFKPDNVISRVEVLKLILEGIKADITNSGKLTFKDTSSDAWYAEYLLTAMKLGVVQGYPDNTFRPGDNINKVEFIKMLVLAMQVDVNPDATNLTFTDVDKSAWYAKYVQFVTEKNIIETDGSRFNPTQKMERKDVAEAIFRVQLLSKTGAEKYTADLVNQIDQSAG